MAARCVALLALLPFSSVFAFSNTVPFVAWSSQSSDALDKLTPGLRPSHGALLEDIFSNGDLCSYDAVVVVDHPGIHSTDLRTLAPSCKLANRIKDAPSSRQLPHVERGLGSSPEAVALLTSRCGSITIDVVPGAGEWALEANKKHVLSISMPPVEGSPRYRKTVMAEHERLLSEELDRLAAVASRHLVIYTGSHIPLERRVLPEPSEFDSPPDDATPVRPISVTSASPKGGILHNYQLLTPALITSLLIAFFLLVPVVMLGIHALASIQSTVRSEAPKDYSAQEKKMQ